ncbi:hypothetical protein ASPZODRAFT_60614 [Penicilliopsis zonata CBS 506.65]|uniref:CAP-Gly domain-containing protein n=1 Tax=Penicilliopsis zonata CBS 506.65 TaxID=1073090 RepID=A0A1L9SQM6_9EURO|nr:hypothetical protein ASPZODRAFT_60614 [Penicilliopsis zonata CBS 506.65]OJJ49403.1 hypothetical protein ASPZODRAFT_60614 [Penicilliopsis zonata CBS 506.65]
MITDPQVGQRRSFGGQLCTIRYVGHVEGTTGDWLGVEWDDPSRGKHSGEHKGVRYFTCRCKKKLFTPASFVRPSRPADKPRGFLEALRGKYASGFEEDLAGQDSTSSGSVSTQDTIRFNGKIAEEVGFEKIRKKLAELHELKIVILDGLLMAGLLEKEVPADRREQEREAVQKTCPKITELDLSRNLLTRWTDVKDICDSLHFLRILKLDGNRFGPIEKDLNFGDVTELHLNDTLLDWNEVSSLTRQFPSLTSLSAFANQLSLTTGPLTNTITTLKLEHNDFDSLAALCDLTALPKLEQLSLKGNSISTVYDTDSEVRDRPLRFSDTLKSVDLSYNKINSWLFVNKLADVFPGLDNLRITGNPLYNQPVASSAVTGLQERPMTVDEVFILTLSRLGRLQLLNFSKIAPTDRTNGELYYLSLIGKELSASPAASEPKILATHPRYQELCDQYGEPTITRASESINEGAVNPRSVAARLLTMTFKLPSSPPVDDRDLQTSHDTKVQQIPRGYDTYQVKALVSRLFKLTPYSFKLVWETDEWDPVSKQITDEDEWDSDQDDGDIHAADLTSVKSMESKSKYIRREIELADSTRDIGFLFQDGLNEVIIRIDRLL